MSYSRWGSSIWYTFATTSVGASDMDKCSDSLSFMAMDVCCIPYNDLIKIGTEAYIQQLKSETLLLQETTYTDKEFSELKSYMDMFIEETQELTGDNDDKYTNNHE